MQREIPKKDEDKTDGGDVALTYPVAHADSISGRTDNILLAHSGTQLVHILFGEQS